MSVVRRWRAMLAAQALLGKTVAAMGGGMFAQFRKVPAELCLPLPDGTSAEAGASAFVNPLTALCFLETMRREGHKALVNTAAASNLGQMLVRLCVADGVPLVNIVRSVDQVRLLRELGATHVLDSSSTGFVAELTEALVATGATIAFDAICGGKLGGVILGCMEAALTRSATSYSRYGSSTHKQLYIYGALDNAGRPSSIRQPARARVGDRRLAPDPGDGEARRRRRGRRCERGSRASSRPRSRARTRRRQPCRAPLDLDVDPRLRQARDGRQVLDPAERLVTSGRLGHLVRVVETQAAGVEAPRPGAHAEDHQRRAAHRGVLQELHELEHPRGLIARGPERVHQVSVRPARGRRGSGNAPRRAR